MSTPSEDPSEKIDNYEDLARYVLWLPHSPPDAIFSGRLRGYVDVAAKLTPAFAERLRKLLRERGYPAPPMRRT